MKKKHIKLAFIFVASITFLNNFVANNAVAGNKIKPYFDKKTISPTLIDNPILVDSQEYKDEINYILNLQKNVDIAQLEKAFNERHLKIEMLFEEILPNISRQNSPQLFNLLDRVNQTSKETNSYFKYFWKTKRPYIASKKVKPLIASHTNPAYPSGHTCGSYVLSYVLSLLYPEYKQQFLNRAEEIAQHRVLVGMHFPHDIKGGKQSSLLIMGGLLQNKNFQKDLEKAQKEIQNKIKNAQEN